jgi:4'-phosphopantetheinyl transferase
MRSEPMNFWPVDLWTLSLLEPRAAILSEDEVERANRFRLEEDRVRWTRSRSALRAILSRYAGASPESLRFIYGQHGKPALSPSADLEFNLSHAGDWTMIAVSRSVPVGVDIERQRPEVDMAALLRRLGEIDLPDTDLDLYKAWARREAKSKTVGGALFDPPPPNICAIDLIAPEGYAAALALAGWKPIVTYCG